MTFGQFRLLASTLSFALFGTFYLPGLGPSPLFPWQEAPQSVLASKCERLWLDEARNDLALECYLASQHRQAVPGMAKGASGLVRLAL